MSTKQFGCFFCKGKSDQPDGFCSDCGRQIDLSTEMQTIRIGDNVVDAILGRGFYGWTVRIKDAFQPFATKLIPKFRVKAGAVTNQEASALAACSPHPNIARFWKCESSSITILNETVEVICIVFEYIPNAVPLRKFLDGNAVVSRSDIYVILAGVAAGLERLDSNHLWHDDLHDDNILVRTLAPDEMGDGRYEAKLIDFGSCRQKGASHVETGERSDYAYMGKHICALTGHFEELKARTSTPSDRFFCQRLRELARVLADPDVSRRDLGPREIRERLRKSLDDSSSGNVFPAFAEMLTQRKISFADPFANTNALYLAPQDISMLFRDSLGWNGRIGTSEPVLIVGPRGCGKTMLLRYHSIEAQARPTINENAASEVNARLAAQDYVGFLVSVSQLRTPFLRSSYKRLEETDMNLAEDFAREFINGHFVYEVLRTVLWLRTERLADLSDDDLSTLVGIVPSLLPAGAAVGKHLSLEQAIEVIEDRLRSMSNLRKPKDYLPIGLAGDDVLTRLATAIRGTSWAARRDVWFLLDDYSLSMLPSLAIRAFNPVVFRPSSAMRMKITSEGDGPPFEDTLRRKYKEGRELSKINLGEVYFQFDEEKGRKFFQDILEARFSETGNHYSLADIKSALGEHPHLKNFGQYIKSIARPGDARFYGFGMLCCLCSGDVSFIIQLLNDLVKLADRKGLPLTATEQDEIIKRFAQRQLADLRAISQVGPRLYSFAIGLGNLLKRHLIASPKGSDQRLRIEVEGVGELTEAERDFHDALLRHSVLVPGGSGKSKAGLPTRRLFFRRLYAPCFPFSPLRKGCIALTVQQYGDWLRTPDIISATAPLPGGIEDSPSLFPI